MKVFVAVAALLLAAFVAFADGAVTVAPASDPPATWELSSITINATGGQAAIRINVAWFTQSGKEAHLDSSLYAQTIVLNGVDVIAFLSAVSPAGSDAFSGTGNAAKRFRQRASKWLIDNGKITRGANES